MKNIKPDGGVFLGATGQFPDGKVSPQDDGELTFSVVGTKEHIVLQFGGPVTWMAISPEMAFALALSLLTISREVKQAESQPLQ